MSKLIEQKSFEELYEEIAGFIRGARRDIARTVNHLMVWAYWNTGKRIYEVEQAGKTRAEYGEKLLQRLSSSLSNEFDKGFSVTNLKYFRQFYLAYKDRIGHEARDQFQTDLSWTHYRTLMKETRIDVRQFYEIEAIKNNWSTPELQRQMGSFLYERLAKSRDKEGLLELSQKGQIIKKPEDVLKDPVVLEFLDIPESHKLVETHLEAALITHLQSFLLELGRGFAFVSRQKRITLNGDHFYPDLVFYHTILKCYIIFEIKTTSLTHSHIGQIQMYVNYFDRKIRDELDNPTIGVVLCAEKNDAVVQFTLPENNNQVFASKYQFHLPTVEELENFVKKEVQEIKHELGE